MIDARGQLCPMPVIMVQKAAKENPPRSRSWWTILRRGQHHRFAGNNGYQITSPAGRGLSADSPQIRYHNEERQDRLASFVMDVSLTE
ncbi:MAG: sulfurtransferase TusA family protein [Oscillospiraceae bacterium]